MSTAGAGRSGGTSTSVRFGRVELRFEARPYDDPDVQRLVAAVQREYVRRYGGPDAAAVATDEFAPPAGLFLVGLLDGVPTATGGWRFISDDTVEIKRMYVLESARRRGIARRMLAELEATAWSSGARRVVLNTGDQQPEAIALYDSAGFEAIEGFGHYACAPGALFYGKALTRRAAESTAPQR
ncbi:MAG: GCN5-related N-acetyltransferase [Pseudonocardiales bacterium]|nr:GCN5-related N-acetyltransferase [Pseudonocardiales bacterium]